MTGYEGFDRHTVFGNDIPCVSMQIMRKVISMLTRDKIHTETNVENPSCRTCENRHGSSVHLGNVFRCYQNTSQKQYGHNDYRHTRYLNVSAAKITNILKLRTM